MKYLLLLTMTMIFFGAAILAFLYGFRIAYRPINDFSTQFMSCINYTNHEVYLKVAESSDGYISKLSDSNEGRDIAKVHSLQIESSKISLIRETWFIPFTYNSEPSGERPGFALIDCNQTQIEYNFL